MATEAFSVAIEIFGPASRHKFCVTTRFGTGNRCLGRDKGPLVLRQSFPKAGPFLSRHKTLCHDRVSQGGVAIKSFLSRPTNQAYALDIAMVTRTTSLGKCMSAHTSSGAGPVTKPIESTTRAPMNTVRGRRVTMRTTGIL